MTRPALGPLLCWAVVFADIGTSVYYAPGILFAQTGNHAPLFIGLTLVVFVLLTLKYSEVAVRYPQGGGVVSVGAQAVNNFVGLLGGLLILVDYFLTSALSALSGLIYLSVVAPGLRNVVVVATVAALILLALLNIVGISADAKVTAVIAAVALGSQLAVVIAVLAHSGVGNAFAAAPKVLSGSPITTAGLLTGYAGAFLAFSGLESISQLAPAMARPQRRTAPRAMLLVVITITMTSPLLTLWATTLLKPAGIDPNQFISLLGGYAGGPLLQVEVATSAALLLVFASNTAMIGCYHVFLALSRMRFLPALLQRRNRWRGTPHWAIAAAVTVPVVVVIVANGNTSILGDMYAFGLLGAFSVTCVSLDIVRWRERRTHRARRGGDVATPTLAMFIVGVITSVLVVTGWTTNLVAKPLATLFGGIITGIGLLVAAATYHLRQRRGLPGPVPVVHRLEHFLQHSPPRRHPIVVVLSRNAQQNRALVQAGLELAAGAPVYFAVISGRRHEDGAVARLREVIDPYLNDDAAHGAFNLVRRMSDATRRRNVHGVYEAEPKREAAISQLRERLRPKEIVGLAGDEALRSTISEGDRRDPMQRDGVAMIRIRTASPR